MAWTDYSSVPPPGTPICAARDVAGAADGVLAVSVTSDAGSFPVLLVQRGDAVRAFVNACPHQYLPLTYRSDRVLSADGLRLICSAHGATFDASTGAVLAGADCDLDAVPVRVVDGTVVVG